MSSISSLIKSLKVATSGMQAQNERMLIISQNLANAESRATSSSGKPYSRKTVTFQSVMDRKTGISKIKVKTLQDDKTPFKKIYAPGEPGADKNGYVLQSNVKPVVEMIDLREASRSHEANLRAYEKSLHMIQETINMLKN